MAAPGTTVSRGDIPPSSTADTDTGKLFIIGMASDGPYDEAVEVESMEEFVDNFGDRQAYSGLYDELDLFFGEGGRRAVVARYTGPAGSNTSGDRTDATATERQAALDLFTADFGPGQVKVASGTDSEHTVAATHALVEAHAEAYGRVAILDYEDTADVATLTTAAGTDQDATGARSSAPFAPWVTIPPLVSGGGDRTVPAGAFFAALAARNDGQGVSPNQAPAGGLYGWSKGYVTGLSQPGWTDTDRATLNTAGVNVVRNIGGVVQVYGNKTLADPVTEAQWTQLSNARFYSALRARALAALEPYVFAEADFNRHLETAIKGDLITLLKEYPRSIGSYSITLALTPAEHRVDVTLSLQMADSADNIDLTIVKVAADRSVA